MSPTETAAAATPSSEPVTEVATRIVEQVDALISRTEEATRPIEIDPYRKELFDLFVQADRAGLTVAGADPDLSAEGLCRELSERWGLKTAAEASLHQQSKMSEQQLVKMRSLWSVMRMWMEWTYAWERWAECHGAAPEQPADPAAE